VLTNGNLLQDFNCGQHSVCKRVAEVLNSAKNINELQSIGEAEEIWTSTPSQTL
jgi:hypothetical protein